MSVPQPFSCTREGGSAAEDGGAGYFAERRKGEFPADGK